MNCVYNPAVKDMSTFYPEEQWTTVKKKHTSKCLRRRPKSCLISKAVRTHALRREHLSILDDLQEVPVYQNSILEAILSEMACICPSRKLSTFYIAPDNKYKIIIRLVTNNEIVLEQWCCHYDRVTQLIPIAVRKVIIKF